MYQVLGKKNVIKGRFCKRNNLCRTFLLKHKIKFNHKILKSKIVKIHLWSWNKQKCKQLLRMTNNKKNFSKKQDQNSGLLTVLTSHRNKPDKENSSGKKIVASARNTLPMNMVIGGVKLQEPRQTELIPAPEPEQPKQAELTQIDRGILSSQNLNKQFPDQKPPEEKQAAPEDTAINESMIFSDKTSLDDYVIGK